MKTFKSIADVDRLRNDPAYSPLHATIKELVSTIGVTLYVVEPFWTASGLI
jgi:hypothetical protein